MKFYLIIFLFICFLGTQNGNCNIAVQRAGITAISPGDMGIIIYFYIENKMDNPYQLQVVTKNCKEDNSPECNITLLGGNWEQLAPRETKKMELVWPTLYVYNRVGSCRIIIGYKDPRKLKALYHYIRYKVYFDTGLQNKEILPAFKAVYPAMKPKCRTEDLDPLTGCLPVDCLIKYGGCKSFFSKETYTCSSINTCVYQSKDPYNGYIPASNTCKNIKTRLQMSEVDRIRQSLPKTSIPATEFYTSKMNPRYVNHNFSSHCDCNAHGRRGNDEDCSSGYCPYHMCNIQVESWKKNYLKKINNTLLVFGILSVLIAIGVLLLTFCCYCLHRCICFTILSRQGFQQPGRYWCDNVCGPSENDTYFGSEGSYFY